MHHGPHGLFPRTTSSTRLMRCVDIVCAIVHEVVEVPSDVVVRAVDEDIPLLLAKRFAEVKGVNVF